LVRGKSKKSNSLGQPTERIGDEKKVVKLKPCGWFL